MLTKRRTYRLKAPEARVHPLVDALRQQRVQLGMSQSELARKAGCAEMTLSGYERGVCSPKLHILEAVAQVLGMQLTLETYPTGDEQ